MEVEEEVKGERKGEKVKGRGEGGEWEEWTREMTMILHVGNK